MGGNDRVPLSLESVDLVDEGLGDEPLFLGKNVRSLGDLDGSQMRS